MSTAEALLQIFEDARLVIVNILDTSKRLVFDVSGALTGKTATIKSVHQDDIILTLPKRSGSIDRIEADRTELIDFTIDYAEAEILFVTLPTNGTLTINNPVQGKSIMIEVNPNGFTLNFPSYVKVISGRFKNTAINYVYFHCINDAVPTYIVTIGQQLA